jgi:hypothetical protein
LTLANSTITHCRGHGVVVVNTSDARVFINETRIEYNWGDALYYRHAVPHALQILMHDVVDGSGAGGTHVH